MSRPRSAPRRRAAGLLLAGALALSGCAGHDAGGRLPGHVLTVYASLPLEGASAAGARAVLDGERLALLQIGGRIGHYEIRLRALDDASPGGGAWDPNQTTANVSLAVQDPTTVGYLGDFNSGATAVAIPLLNPAGILAISPTATAVGLTSAGPGAAPGEPAKYYPTGVRTFVAVAPDDVAQASAQVQIQKSLGCTRTVVLNDGEFDGYDAAASFGLVAHAEGLAVVGSESFDPQAIDYTSLARSLTGVAPDCVLISALPGPRTATLTAEVAAALPHAHLFATAPLAQPAFADAKHGGIPAALAPRVLITVPSAAPAPGVRAAFARRFGSPGPFGLYGYAAMRLLLDAIARTTHGGREPARRPKVREALFALHNRATALGRLSVRRDGTTSLRAFTVLRVVAGRLVPWTEVWAPGD